MTKHSLTTTRKTVIEPASVDRVFLITAGLFATSADVVYLALGQGSDVDVILSSAGTTHTRLQVPTGQAVEAWTNTGTAELATLKQSCPAWQRGA